MNNSSKFFTFVRVLLVMALSVPLMTFGNNSSIANYLAQPSLQGEGQFTYFGFHIYDAALYRSRIDSSQEFALEIRYRKSFTGKSIAEQSIQEMKKLGYDQSKLSEWGKDLNRIFPNIESGQSLTAIYKPLQGTIFLFNGQKIAQIQSAEFSKAFFSIWLDSKTTAPNLREKLLSQNCPPPLISEKC